MPLLLSPSLASNVDRPPTYLSDNTSTPSTTASMTPSIKCEPTEHNCASHQNSLTINCNFSNKNFENNNSDERIIEKVDTNVIINDKNIERHSKTLVKHRETNATKQSVIPQTVVENKQLSQQKTITTTITESIPTKTKEKYSARVEPLMRIEETIDKVIRNGNQVCSDLNDETIDSNTNCKTFESSAKTTSIETNNRNESPNKDRNALNNNQMDSHNNQNTVVKRELIECDMSLPLNSVKSVPNCNQINSNSNTNDLIANNTELNNKKKQNSIELKNNDNLEIDNKNLIIENDCSNSNSSDGKDVLVINTDINNCKSKDAKRESQLKQLQSYRKGSHRLNNKSPVISDSESMVNGLQNNTTPTAISIVLPKPNDQINGDNKKPFGAKLVNKSSDSGNHSLTCLPSNIANRTTEPIKSSLTAISNATALQSGTHPKTQTVIPCRTKSVQKMTTNMANNLSANQTQQQKQSINVRKLDNNSHNESNNQLTSNINKMSQNSTNTATKQLPKKPRMSRKSSSAAIPIGIAIAQQRTSPKTKSPTDSATNSSQPLKPILPTLSLPVMANSPILITDSPPAGTSLWIKPTANATINNNNSLQTNSQFSLTGDYQLARDSLTGIEIFELYFNKNYYIFS